MPTLELACLRQTLTPCWCVTDPEAEDQDSPDEIKERISYHMPEVCGVAHAVLLDRYQNLFYSDQIAVLLLHEDQHVTQQIAEVMCRRMEGQPILQEAAQRAWQGIHDELQAVERDEWHQNMRHPLADPNITYKP